MKRNAILTVLVFALVCLMTSCFSDNINDMLFDHAAVNLAVSAENGRSMSKNAKAVFQTEDIHLDASYYRTEVQGEPYLEDITPIAFILDIDRIYLYDPKDKEDATQGSKRTIRILDVERVGSGGWIIPNRVNMLSSKKISNVPILAQELAKKWNGLCVQMLPGGFGTTNGMWAGSAVCVKLPDGLSRNKIRNALQVESLPENVEHRDEEGYVWIGFDSLLPFKNENFGFLCFQYGAKGVHFINSEHANGEWVFGPEYSIGNPAGIVLPMERIDFSGMKEAELVFMFDTNECLDFYEVEPDSYWITLKKTNPLPFKIITQEYDSSSVVLDESQMDKVNEVASPIQCFVYDWSFDGKENTLVFTYTRPNANAVDTIRIYASPDAVFDKETAEIIYEGSNHSYCIPSTEESRVLHYFITAVNKDGKESLPTECLYKVAAHRTF